MNESTSTFVTRDITVSRQFCNEHVAPFKRQISKLLKIMKVVKKAKGNHKFIRNNANRTLLDE